MKRFIVRAAATAAVLLAPLTATAQGERPPEAIAASKAAGDKLLTDADAADLFTNETDNAASITLRHTASGMRCLFETARRADNQVILITQILPRGEDVACQTPAGRASVTFYATRAPGVTPDMALDSAAGAIKMNWRGAKPWKPSGRSQDLLSKSEKAMAMQKLTRTAWFRINEDGGAYVTRVSVGEVDGWVIKMRATAPAMDAPIVEMLFDLFWLGAYASAYDTKNPDAWPAPK
ncbi:hypothetical protein [Caulobacter mirabilis]|uniref:Uncharacterized protein n=1 Tax=Caulobacter mirabilis TaxID=69666 RepID=A0A2D2B0G0_9CAUL|nr:hypothetical protein [Caulobacter mirabilis]ATQ43721.1 hypothetical protein CSW64_15630 [Caulobacter mirabilis]